MNNPNTGLPVGVQIEIENLIMDHTLELRNDNDFQIGYEKGMEKGIEIGATAYATKLIDCDRANSALEEKVRGLEEAGKQVLEELRKENKMKDGAVWVKCSDRLPGYKTRVKWRDGNDHSYATDGKISLFEMDKPNLDGWEWLNEFTSKEGNKERKP